ncbi:MAG: hypothetical protein N3F04_02300 [Candidatus Nezhaarchaeota archaeon]|nr:hypothetical protein [Candidatus Nezhaarchaeota archaeon]MCX8141609.1 hypothetical protein [Candidatus Nezhaarchaeota archaeon]MDW8049876.1 hypothetical protein [Nitrososphaerota archaeon]
MEWNGERGEMMGLPRSAIEAFNLERAGKFLATISEDKEPNVVPILSLRAFDEETLVFGELMMLKTKKNLIKGCSVCVCVVTDRLENYIATGIFEGFERVGKYYNFISEVPLFKYNPYMGARAAGVIKVKEVWQVERAKSKLKTLIDVFATKFLSLREGERHLHPLIAEKFNRINAVKVLAYLERAQPIVVPTMSMRAAAAGSKLVFGISSTEIYGLKAGERVAASVLTMDATAYQVKGVYEGEERTLLGRVGVINVSEAYTLTPPRPGEKVPLTLH